MIQECFSLMLFFASFNMSALLLPYFSTSPNFFGLKLSNLTCTDINGGNLTINVSSNQLSLNNANSIFISCEANLDVHSYHGRLEFMIDVEDTDINLRLITENHLWRKSLNKIRKTVEDDENVIAHNNPHFSSVNHDEIQIYSCSSGSSEVVNCSTRVYVPHLVSVPSDTFVETMLSKMKSTIEEDLNKYVCGVKLEETRIALKNKTTVKPQRSLPLRENATAVESVKLLRSLVNIINFLQFNVNGTKIICHAALLNHTRLTITISNEQRLIFKNLNYSTLVNVPTLAYELVEQLLNYKKIYERRKEFHQSMRQLTETLVLSFPHLIMHGSIKTSIPANSHLSIDVDFDGLQCSGEQSLCSIPCESGLQFSNLRLLLKKTTSKQTFESTQNNKYFKPFSNKLLNDQQGSGNKETIDDGDVYRLFTNHVAQYIISEVNSELNNFFCAQSSQRYFSSEIHVLDNVLENFTQFSSGKVVNETQEIKNLNWLEESISKISKEENYNESRYLIYLPTSVEPQKIAPWWIIYLIIPASIIQSVGLILYSIYQNRQHPIIDLQTNKEVSLQRIILEDGTLSIGVSICEIAFIWSNSTYGASVCFGQEMYIYSFSLLNTVHDLWSAGLRVLAIFVLLFSGIYPYIKLYTIIIMTVILQRPESLALKIVDLLGKFSFIDTFVMIIMVSGLEIKNIADVHILPSFYIFLLGTVGSIILGNIATCEWRKKTSLRRDNHYNSQNEVQVIAYSAIDSNNNNNNENQTGSVCVSKNSNSSIQCTSKSCLKQKSKVAHEVVEVEQGTILAQSSQEEVHEETEHLL